MNDGPDARARPGSRAVRVRRLELADWEAVAAIYREGLDTGDASFETAVPTWEAWDRTHLPRPRLLAEVGAGQPVGWAALSPVSARPAYAGVAEISIYVARAARGRGVGAALLGALVGGSEDAGIWTLQAGVFPENVASLRLHERAGFRRVGVRERIGVRAGRWRDVILLERRSPAVGVR